VSGQPFGNGNFLSALRVLGFAEVGQSFSRKTLGRCSCSQNCDFGGRINDLFKNVILANLPLRPE